MRQTEIRKNIDQKKKKNFCSIAPETILKLLYPPRCPVCDRILRFRASGCCDVCAEKLPWVTGPVCMKCGKPVGGEEQEYCDDCCRYRHYFDQGTAAFTYSGELRRSVYRMKSDNRRDYLDFYAEALSGAASGKLARWQPQVILPVPMYPAKKRRRGYNQSELLAVRIGRLTGIPVNTGQLKCIRKTPDQKSLNRRQRMQNLKGCFELSDPATQLSRVLLVDDIYTTGSTMDELSRVLKQNGVDYVYFAVLCIGKGS